MERNNNYFERLTGVVLTLGCAASALGVALDKWSPAVAGMAMSILVLLGTLGQLSRVARRISDIYALTVVFSVVGIALIFIGNSTWTAIIGVLIAGIGWWALNRIKRKNWVLARK